MSPLQAPMCGKCRRRHVPELRCWTGRYVAAVLVDVLTTYGDVCVHCHRPGADSVEHVRPRSLGGTDAIGNLRPAHKGCNSRRGTRAMPGFGARTVVIMGPPASGKTTHVLEHAERGDIVIDLDALARALTVGYDGAEYPDHVRHVAIGARAEAIRRATRLREAVTVWLIHAMPSPEQLATYESSGCELVTIDPGRAVVLERCARLRPGRAMIKAEQWYASRYAVGTTSTTSRRW